MQCLKDPSGSISIKKNAIKNPVTLFFVARYGRYLREIHHVASGILARDYEPQELSIEWLVSDQETLLTLRPYFLGSFL